MKYVLSTYLIGKRIKDPFVEPFMSFIVFSFSFIFVKTLFFFHSRSLSDYNTGDGFQEFGNIRCETPTDDVGQL